MLCEGLQWPDATFGAGSNPRSRDMQPLPWIVLLVLLCVTSPISATEEPPGCAGLSAQVRANFMEMRDGKLVPVCPVEPQAEREAADPCKQLGKKARRISSQWSTAQEYMKIQRYKHLSVTARDTHLHHIKSSGHATSMVADAEQRYPTVLDQLLTRRCADDMPYGVKHGYTNPLLSAMVQKGNMTWEKWETWEWKNLTKP